MDLQKAGALIRKLRLEKQMTQRQLAEKMGVAPKTISKWEFAQGFPDVSLLPDLSDALGTDMTSLLSGQRNEKEKDGGNMKRIQFYTCPACGNILTATGGAEIACCGRKLSAMKARACDETHALHVEEMDAESPDDKSAFHPLYRVRRHGTRAARAAVSRTECRGAHAENAACDVVYRMQRRWSVHMQAEIKKKWKKTETNAALGSSYR